MAEVCNYHIRVRGWMQEEDLNSANLPQLLAQPVIGEPASTLIVIHTDQSGLIGVLRYLHNRGVVILALQTEF